MDDLNSKVIHHQQRRFEQFVTKAADTPLVELMTVAVPLYRKEAAELAERITVQDLKQFNDGTYFGESLFFACFQLLKGVHHVAEEIAKLP